MAQKNKERNMLVVENGNAVNENNFSKIVERAKTTKDGFIVTMTFRELLRFYKEGIILPDPDNRAGNVHKDQIKKMAENFKVHGFGLTTASYVNGLILLVDAHHRFETLDLMNDMLEFDKVADKQAILNIVPSSSKQETYMALNSNNRHSGKEKINHPSNAVGSYSCEIIAEAETRSGDSIVFDRGKTQNLMDIVLSYDDHGTGFQLEDVYKNRSRINKLLETAKDRRSFSLKDESVKKSKDFLTKYLSLVYNAKKDAKTEVLSTIKSSGFFVALALDYFTSGCFGGISKESNTKIIKKVGGSKLGKIKEQTETLARRNRKYINLITIQKTLE
jgi:hypothetical protein